MIPTIGRTVIVQGISSNGATEAPAVITRTWSQRSTAEGAVAVNVTVFPDAAAPETRTSVMLFHTRQEAAAHRGGNALALAAHWPD